MADLTQYTGGSATAGGTTIGQWVGTESEYNAIATPDPHTLYFITEDPA